MLYRYSTKDTDIGIITTAYEYDFNDHPKPNSCENEIFRLTAIFEYKLKAPDIRVPEGTKFFFTSKGNRKFHKAIKKLSEFLKENNIAEISCTKIDEKKIKSSNIIYSDDDQIAVFDYEGSTTSA